MNKDKQSDIERSEIKMDKKQSIQDKINQMKKKKEMNDKERYKQRLLDLSRRSNNKSRMKLTFTNDIDTNKLILWIMSKEIMKYTLLDSNEEILCEEMYIETLMEIDNQFINYWEMVNDNVELHNIFMSIDFYEDMEIDNCEVYKRDIQFDNLNVVVGGLYVADKLLNIGEDKVNHNDMGDIKDNLFKLIFDCMVKLERLRIKKDICCICEDCMGELKKEQIIITGTEQMDLLKLNDIDISKLNMIHTNINENQSREEQIQDLVNNIVNDTNKE